MDQERLIQIIKNCWKLDDDTDTLIVMSKQSPDLAKTNKNGFKYQGQQNQGRYCLCPLELKDVGHIQVKMERFEKVAWI